MAKETIWLMDCTLSPNPFKTTTAISLITLLLSRNRAIILLLGHSWGSKHGIHLKMHNGRSAQHTVLHMCCGCPGCEVAARSTGIGPAREPTVGSRPAVEGPHVLQRSLHLICAYSEAAAVDLAITHIYYNYTTTDTHHVGLFGGLGYSVTSLTVISGWKGDRLHQFFSISVLCCSYSGKVI